MPRTLSAFVNLLSTLSQLPFEDEASNRYEKTPLVRGHHEVSVYRGPGANKWLYKDKWYYDVCTLVLIAQWLIGPTSLDSSEWKTTSWASFGARTKFIRHSWWEFQIGKIYMPINGGLRYSKSNTTWLCWTFQNCSLIEIVKFIL